MTNATPDTTEISATQLPAADVVATGDLIDRISREQDDVIAQLDDLLLRIDQVLQVTLAEIKSESAQSQDLSLLEVGSSASTLEFSSPVSNPTHTQPDIQSSKRTTSKAA